MQTNLKMRSCKMENLKGYYSTFVIRIRDNKNGGLLKGDIQHIGTEEQAHFRNHFRNIEGIYKFMQKYLNLASGDIQSQSE